MFHTKICAEWKKTIFSLSGLGAELYKFSSLRAKFKSIGVTGDWPQDILLVYLLILSQLHRFSSNELEDDSE
jgi:hypothetical protein